MSTELPVLRLGTVGFNEAQEQRIAALAQAAAGKFAAWTVAPLGDADALWLAGSHTQLLPNGILRVSPATLSGRAVQLAMADVDRPVAFTVPIAARNLAPSFRFDLADPAAAAAMLHKFTAWLQPMLAQYCLAACITR